MPSPWAANVRNATVTALATVAALGQCSNPGSAARRECSDQPYWQYRAVEGAELQMGRSEVDAE